MIGRPQRLVDGRSVCSGPPSVAKSSDRRRRRPPSGSEATITPAKRARHHVTTAQINHGWLAATAGDLRQNNDDSEQSVDEQLQQQQQQHVTMSTCHRQIWHTTHWGPQPATCHSNRTDLLRQRRMTLQFYSYHPQLISADYHSEVYTHLSTGLLAAADGQCRTFALLFLHFWSTLITTTRELPDEQTGRDVSRNETKGFTHTT